MSGQAEPESKHAGVDAIRARRLRRLARLFSPRRRKPLPFVEGNDVALLINGNRGFSSMLAEILAARHSIDIEMYIWRDDTIGRRFCELIKARSREGLRVRVLYDAVGCFQEPRSFWREMRDAGVEVVAFNPIASWRARPSGGRLYRRRTINHRDHRKIILIDNAVAFTGGINIGDEYTGDGGSLRHWRDTSIRLRGPVVAQLAALFEDQWCEATNAATSAARPADAPAPAGNHVAVALGSSFWRSNLIHRTILTALHRARREIEVTAAYFAPPPRTIRALVRAARRGVRVTLLLPSRSDVRAIFYAGRSQYSRLLKAGVRIFECQGTVLHAKSVQVDAVWGTVGSANMDMRSFRLNDEVNVFVLGRSFARDLQRTFASDLERSTEVTRDQWQRRPWLDKLRERFYRLFRACL